jgi:hypothetical protein
MNLQSSTLKDDETGEGDVPSPVETRRRLSDVVAHVISVSAASV